MKSVRISSRALIVPGRGGGWSPKATRREETVILIVRGVAFGMLWWFVVDLRSSELKTWPF
jgi:hypothetical protein